MIALLFLLIILTIVKNYITIILLVSFLLAFTYFAIQRIKIVIFRIIVIVIILFTVITSLITLDISPYIKDFVHDSVSQIQLFQKGYQAVQEDDERSRATFMMSDIDPSLESILINSPVVIGTCLFRPFVWESPKVIIFMASLEALITLLMTVYVIGKTKVLWFFKYILTDNILFFCFTFSILFALVIGYTTFNFGTMIRYKIIFLPFYFFMLIEIYGRYQQAHGNKKLT